MEYRTMFNSQSRNGLTLIELLVVIILLTTLVAAAIPVLAPAGSDRELREATRGLNTYITGAQSRATLTRRPFGIAIKRLSEDTNTDSNKNLNPSRDIHPDNGVSLEVFYVEQQPPFSGLSSNSRVCVCNYNLKQVGLRFVTYGPGNGTNLPPGWSWDAIPDFLIRPGDVIEIGKMRYRFDVNGDVQVRDNGGYISNVNGNPQTLPVLVTQIHDTGHQIGPEYDDRGRPLRDGPPKTGPTALQQPYWTAPLPYRILRQPTKTADAPYQLPEGTAIDLRASGIGKNRFFHSPPVGSNDDYSVDNSSPIYIMFTPEGRVERVTFSELPFRSINATSSSTEPTTFSESITDNIFLLLGKRENVPPAVASDVTLDSTRWGQLSTDQQRLETKQPINWLNGESRWVVIGSQSGRVVSIENAFVDPAAILGTYSTQTGEQKRNQQILAAREFTREMANMGGR